MRGLSTQELNYERVVYPGVGVTDTVEYLGIEAIDRVPGVEAKLDCVCRLRDIVEEA